MTRMTDTERETKAQTDVAAALTAYRAGDNAEVNQLFAHAVHAGVQPFELLREIIDQTGGRL